jgi:hypothetical protein
VLTGFKEGTEEHRHTELAGAAGAPGQVKHLRQTCARVEDNSLWIRLLRMFNLAPALDLPLPEEQDNRKNIPIGRLEEIEMPNRSAIASGKARITNTRLAALENYLKDEHQSPASPSQQ